MGTGQSSQQPLQETPEAKQKIPDDQKERLYEELEVTKLEQKDIQDIKEKAKTVAEVINPLIICISTKKNYINSEEKSNDIKIIEGETHKDIKQELTHIINNFNTKYDAIIVVPIGICFVGEANSIKFFYDKQETPRHIEKIKKDIVYRLDEPAVLIDCRKAVIFPIKDEHNNNNDHDDENILTENLRPGGQMEHTVRGMQIWKNFEAMKKTQPQTLAKSNLVKDQNTKPRPYVNNNETKEEEEYDGQEQKYDE
eukprot:73706_1